MLAGYFGASQRDTLENVSQLDGKVATCPFHVAILTPPINNQRQRGGYDTSGYNFQDFHKPSHLNGTYCANSFCF
jgi:hypothetical protein